MTAPPWLLARPIAHRGLHDRAEGIVENSIAAAEAAIAGRYAIECDVQISADGEAMVFHDHDLDRLTAGSGTVRSRTAAELERLELTGGRGDRIPTLTAFLDRIGGRTPLIVEVKSRFDGSEALTRRLVDVLAGRPDPVVAKSFDPAVVALLRRLAPTLPRGIVGQSRYEGGDWARLDEETRHGLANLLHWSETRPDFLSWRHLDLPNAATHLPRLLAGVPVMSWTVRSEAEARRVGPHVDQVVFEGFRPA